MKHLCLFGFQSDSSDVLKKTLFQVNSNLDVDLKVIYNSMLKYPDLVCLIVVNVY